MLERRLPQPAGERNWLSLLFLPKQLTLQE
jgi:hypothetical protein